MAKIIKMKYILFVYVMIVCSGILKAQETTLYDTIFRPEESIKYELVKSKGLLHNGLKVGFWKSWYDNGQLMIQGEYAILLNKDIKIVNHEDCNECIVSEDTVRKQLQAAYSIETGKWETYYKNGKLMQTGSFLPEYTIDINWAEVIDDDGTRRNVYSLPIYLQALETGVWNYYDETGKFTNKKTFVKGQPVN
jgi:hypothetical protein